MIVDANFQIFAFDTCFILVLKIFLYVGIMDEICRIFDFDPSNMSYYI